jgi:hypothetical protein
MTFGAVDQASAPFVVQVQTAATPPTAQVELRPTRLEQLAGPLGVALPVQGVTASAKARLQLPATLGGGPIEGEVSSALDGFVPPHPVELNGFIFGDRTTLDTKLSVSPDGSTVTLTDTVVEAGAFRLKGGGRIERQTDHAIVRMDLSGNLSCSAVADAAARARIGSVLGRLLGKTAKKVFSGSVAVRVRVLADTRNLPAASVERQIGIGCGLKPLTLDDIVELGLSDEARQIVGDLPTVVEQLPSVIKKGLPALPSGLPPLPSALPPIPSSFPRIRIELPKIDDKKRLADPNEATAP